MPYLHQDKREGSKIASDMIVYTDTNKSGKSRAVGGGAAGFSGLLNIESSYQIVVHQYLCWYISAVVENGRHGEVICL